MSATPRAGAPTNPARWIPAATLCGLVLVLARSWSYFALPPLEYEDGASIFAHFYVHRDVGELLRFKSGYLPLPQNAMGWISARIDPRGVPYFLTWLPLLFAGAVYAFVAGRPGARLVRHPLTRSAFPFVALVAPIGQIHLLAHTDYSINNCALFVTAATCVWPLRLRRTTWIAVNLLVWTHPLTSLAAPFLLWDAWRRPGRDRGWRLLTAANCVVHVALGVRPESSLSLADLLSGLETVPRFVSFTTTWVTLGPGLSASLRAVAPWAVHAWALGILGIVVWASVRTPRLARPFLRTGLVICAWAGATVATRGVEYTLEMIQFRYWFVPGLLVILVVMGALAGFVRPRLRSGLAVALAAWFAAMNLGDVQWYGPRHPDNGPAVRDLMRQLHEHELETGTWRGQRAEVTKTWDWTILIDTR